MASLEPPSGANAAEEGDPEDADEGDDEAPLNAADDADDGAEAPEESEEGEEGNDPTEDLPNPPPAPEIKDDAKVKVSIDGEDKEFTVGALKALAGQEAELGRRNEEVEFVGGQAAATLQAALEIVQEDLEPYTKVDWLVLQQQVDPETFQWHRENAARLDAKLKKLTGTAQGFETVLQQRRSNNDASAARAALRELSTDIPDWGEKAYGEILDYGATQGLSRDELATVTNPKVLKIIRKAMLHDRAEKVTTEKVKAAPTKVIKGGNRTDNSVKAVSLKRLETRLASSGSDEDAMALLMGRMS